MKTRNTELPPDIVLVCFVRVLLHKQTHSHVPPPPPRTSSSTTSTTQKVLRTGSCCPKCGRPVGPDHKFCDACGTPAPAPLRPAASSLPIPPPPPRKSEPQARVRCQRCTQACKTVVHLQGSGYFCSTCLEQRAERAEEQWVYRPADGLPIAVRSQPWIDSARTGRRIAAGETFRVTETLPGQDNVLYLRLAGGDGWLFDRKPGVGIMCVQIASPAAQEASRGPVPAPIETTRRSSAESQQALETQLSQESDEVKSDVSAASTIPAGAIPVQEVQVAVARQGSHDSAFVPRMESLGHREPPRFDSQRFDSIGSESAHLASPAVVPPLHSQEVGRQAARQFSSGTRRRSTSQDALRSYMAIAAEAAPESPPKDRARAADVPETRGRDEGYGVPIRRRSTSRDCLRSYASYLGSEDAFAVTREPSSAAASSAVNSDHPANQAVLPPPRAEEHGMRSMELNPGLALMPRDHSSSMGAPPVMQVPRPPGALPAAADVSAPAWAAAPTSKPSSSVANINGIRVRLGVLEFQSAGGGKGLFDSVGFRVMLNFSDSRPSDSAAGTTPWLRPRWIEDGPATQPQQLKFGRHVSHDGIYTARMNCEFDEAIDLPLSAFPPSCSRLAADVWLECRSTAERLDSMLGWIGLGSNLPEYDRTWLGRTVITLPPMGVDNMPYSWPVEVDGAANTGPSPKSLSIGLEWVATDDDISL
eukprot:TRINITY_DN7948_c0_g1_i3.p1 TRINITY_DN7948_c0_g1~~TRINITY_DN7948_c0_g1_i3.p1  ORF type:complete len:703 (+),score=76.57 TRINITY_DN7948_c0_g1_i3:1133-3241(+)